MKALANIPIPEVLAKPRHSGMFLAGIHLIICKQLILWIIRFAHPSGRPTGVQRAPRFCPAFAGMTYFGVLQEPHPYAFNGKFA
jgi:hypothetical protein